MSDLTTSATPAQIKLEGRAYAKSVLSGSPVFASLSFDEQRDTYTSLVQEYMDKRLPSRGNGGGLARSMATDSGKDMGYKGYDPGFSGDTKAFNELVESVDFPKFVADLLKAVFDANLAVMKQQTDSYIKLMKEATKSAADFIKQIKDEESFAKLAERKSDQYNVVTEREGDKQKLALTDAQGGKVDLEDAQVKRDVLEEKLNMAKEHRAALREVLLMGVTRLVVNKGVIEAGVDFTIHATRKSDAHHEDQNINVANVHGDFSMGWLGSGGFEDTNTNIQVNTSDKHATDDLTATLHGKVNIEFKTDYFKLDNFANMYADGGTAAFKPPGAPGAPAPAPALPAGGH